MKYFILLCLTFLLDSCQPSKKEYDLGRISEGAYADMVIFDENKIQDKATYTNSREFAVGIEYMVINGKFVIYNSKLTGSTPGSWIKSDKSL